MPFSPIDWVIFSRERVVQSSLTRLRTLCLGNEKKSTEWARGCFYPHAISFFDTWSAQH